MVLTYKSATPVNENDTVYAFISLYGSDMSATVIDSTDKVSTLTPIFSTEPSGKLAFTFKDEIFYIDDLCTLSMDEVIARLDTNTLSDYDIIFALWKHKDKFKLEGVIDGISKSQWEIVSSFRQTIDGVVSIRRVGSSAGDIHHTYIKNFVRHIREHRLKIIY